MQDIEEFDKLKTKVLKYILYKKRTEQEIRQKFSENAGNNLENVIEYLKENDYINDNRYIEKDILEFKKLKNLSIKELKYKLLSKGLSKSQIEDYIYLHKEELEDYELQSATTLYNKKETIMEPDEIYNYLQKKGYMEQTIRSLQNE